MDGADRLVTRNFLALGGGEALARVVGFVATIYIARVLGASSYGIIEFAAAIVLYASRVADGGIDLGLGVREIAAHPARLPKLVPPLLSARLVLSVLLTGLLSAIGIWLLPQPEGRVLALYSLTLVAVGAGTRWIHLGLERARPVAVAQTLGQVLMVALVIAVVRVPADLVRVPMARVAGDLAAAMILLAALRGRGIRLTLQWDWSLLRPLLGRAWPLVLSSLLGLIMYNSDLIFLRVFRSAAHVGYYAAAYALISFLANLGTAYSLSLLPTATRLGREADRQRRLLDTATARVVAVGLPLAIGGSFLAGPVIALVFGPAYQPAALALAILLWSVPLGLLRDIPIVALMAVRREVLVLRLTAWAAGLNLILNLLLIPRYGILGAAGASVATEGVRWIVALAYSGSMGFRFPRFSRFRKTLLAGGAMAAVLLFATALPLFLAAACGAGAYLATLWGAGGIRWRGGELPRLDV